jgi:hypothetical protein
MELPDHSINYGAVLPAATACSVGDVLVPNVGATAYILATTANRAGRGSECVALSAYGGVGVGSVRAAQNGILPASKSGLGTAVSRQLVRCSALGRIERVSSYTAGDDIIGFAETDGRVHLMFGMPFELIAAAGASPGGSDGDMQYRVNATTFGGITGSNGDVIYKSAGVWGTTPAVQVPSGTGVVGVTGGALDAAGSLGTALQVLRTNAAATAFEWSTPATGFTAGGDLSGTSSSQQVEAATGLTNLFTLRATAPTMQWVVATTTPRINQADVTTNSATGQAMTIQAQNATGTTATGGQLALSSGTGTSSAGNVNIQTGGTTALSCQPTVVAVTPAFFQFGATTVNPTFRQATDATNSITGDTLTVQAQNCTGTTTAGGNLILTSGTGTSSNGLLELQVGGSPRMQLTGTAFALGDILVGDGTKLIRRAKGSALQVLRVNAGGTDLEFATTSITGSDTHIMFFDGANNPAGDADLTWNKTTNVMTINASGRIIWGASAHTTGALAFPYPGGVARIIIGRVDSGASNRSLLTDGPGDGYTVGNTSQDATYQGVVMQVTATSTYTLTSGVSTTFVSNTSSIAFGVPRHGNATPYASEGMRTVAVTGLNDITLSSSQYDRRIVNMTANWTGAAPHDVTFPLPSGDTTAYEKIVINATDADMVVGNGGGGTVTVEVGAIYQLIFTASGVAQVL